MGLADYIKTKLPYWPNWVNNILLHCNILKGWAYGPAYKRYAKVVESSTPEEKLLKIVNYAIDHVPYYRSRYNGLTINSIKDFEEKIGFIDKDEVMSHWDEFVSDEIDWNKVSIGTTGGTSGKPLKLVTPCNRYVHAMYFWHKALKEYGWNYHTMAVIRNHKIPSGRDYIINPIMRQIIFDGFNTSDSYFYKVWKLLKRKRIKFLYAYPSGAYAFLKSCYTNNLDVSFLKGIFLTSEPITPLQKNLIQDVLQLPLQVGYGHSEKLCSAGYRPHQPLYYIDEQYGYTELISDNKVIDKPGVEGEITGTTFINYSFPLIRYKTGDFASYMSTKSTPRVLTAITGRRNNVLIYKNDGSTVTTTALNLHGKFYEHISGFQYLQEKKGYLIAHIVKDQTYTDNDHKFITDYLSSAMGGVEFVEIRYVDEVILQPNGKFLPIISKI